MTEARTTTLYRPMGRGEYELVAASGFRRWPPRLPEQPIFYPVTTERYAHEVNAWNLSEQGEGFVARFEVQSEFMARFALQTVGAERHQEWWVPAEELEALNDHIVGTIEILAHTRAE